MAESCACLPDDRCESDRRGLVQKLRKEGHEFQSELVLGSNPSIALYSLPICRTAVWKPGGRKVSGYLISALDFFGGHANEPITENSYSNCFL